VNDRILFGPHGGIWDRVTLEKKQNDMSQGDWVSTRTQEKDTSKEAKILRGSLKNVSTRKGTAKRPFTTLLKG